MSQLALELQPVVQSYRLIPLSRGQFAIVDAEDFDWINQWKWSASRSRDNGFYAVRRETVGFNEDGTRLSRIILMHRVILGCCASSKVDHIDTNKLNNRRNNLRLATTEQNSYNRPQQRNNTSGFKGIKKNHSRWMARIGRNGRYLGTFDTKEQASEAYQRAACEAAGEFARW